MIYDLGRRLASEALGTALLVATVVGSGIMAAKLAGGNTAIALLGNTIPRGAILVVLITILGPISGAPFNPVVSLVMTLRGELPKAQFAPFVLVQVIGGCLGTLAAYVMFDLPLLQLSTTARTGAAQWFAEGVAAVATILGCIRARPEFVATGVGLYITAAYWFTASTSFANPAVTIARAMTNSFAGIHPAHVLGFIAAQVVGALTGWLVMDWLLNPKSTNSPPQSPLQRSEAALAVLISLVDACRNVGLLSGRLS